MLYWHGMLVYTVIFVLLLAGFTGFTHAEMPAGNSDPNPVNENNPLLPVAMFRSNGNPAPLKRGDIGGIFISVDFLMERPYLFRSKLSQFVDAGLVT